ncbi:MAG: CvpA family protein [Oscillospiraceae bacterium]|nr:CvpA family protein [Oscillospiraceae bacterium]
MNAVDYAVIGVVLASLLFGLYKGFIRSVVGLLGLFAAMYAAYVFSPRLVAWISGNQTLLDTLMYYTDASIRMSDVTIANTLVSGLSQSQIVSIVAQAGLPAPFDILLENNMVGQVYAALPQATVSEYLNQTVISAIIKIVSYVAVFIAAYAAATLLVNLLHYVFRFPVLRQFDMLLGGAFGAVRGIFLVYILFSLAPILMTVVPFPQLAEAVRDSQFGDMLLSGKMIQTILQGGL